MVKASIDESIDIIFSGAGLPLDLSYKLIKKSVKLWDYLIKYKIRAAFSLYAKDKKYLSPFKDPEISKDELKFCLCNLEVK